MDLPYRAEYAKSGRSSCKGCKKSVQKGALRLAVMVQSPMFDGKVPQWYHTNCFFKKQRPQTTDDIEHYESLRVTDQDTIKEHVGQPPAAVVPDKKGRKRASDKASKDAALKEFKIEYSKSGRAACRGCQQKILKGEIRIAKKDYESESAKRYGGLDRWHHVTCFSLLRSELAYFECGDKLPGFKSLTKDDQKDVATKIPTIKQEDVPDAKKLRTEDSVEVDPETEKEYREQNEIMFKYRDQLAELHVDKLHAMIGHNNQYVPVGKERMLDLLADIMTFGALPRCEKCNGGPLVFNKAGYTCNGDLTEWTKCNTTVKEPKRVPFIVVPQYAHEYQFLNSYTYVPRTRIIKDIKPTSAGKAKDEGSDEPKVQRDLPPLYDMEFVIAGQPPRGKDAVKKQVASMGGKVVTRIKDTTMAIISTKEEVKKMTARMREAESHQIHVVPEEFLDEAKDSSGKIPNLIIKMSLCNWGKDPNTRLPSEPSTSYAKSISRSRFVSSGPSKIKVTLKSGIAVDPLTGLENTAHVHQENNIKYSVVLSGTDIQTKKNSYYKIQLLAGDKVDYYWVFRSWGRIGTTIGGNKLEIMPNLQHAKNHFAGLYRDKTGNSWLHYPCFVKEAGKMCPIDIDYGDEESDKLAIVETEETKSKLDGPVQDLMKIIFNVSSMKRLMLEFELDTEKMPLGKLSKSQIRKAYAVLSELLNLINNNNTDESLFIDASNRFYTFIPHSFGVDDPPILKNPELVKQKLEMLESLMELEIAYSLMKASGSEHTVDSYYTQLKAEIQVLDRNCEEFSIIKEYVKNTHAATHSNYDLEIEEAYIVKRQGEDKRFKSFRKLHNHKLLWHGSRTTNFAGILSQGLRIAPPEAPVTGYMFGKGIYFADMVSKSANYCCTSVGDPTGLLLLCDVALGNMDEHLRANYIEQLPKGKHSCKGVGRTHPDPTGAKAMKDIEVPIGKGIANPEAAYSALLYNEYIVYDVAQVNVKYLLRLGFKYKY